MGGRGVIRSVAVIFGKLMQCTPNDYGFLDERG